MRNRKGAAAIGVACALFAVACSSSSSKSSSTTAAASNTTAAGSATTAGGAATTAAANGSGPWGWPGDATQGYLAPKEPDVNGDGKVVLGVISPGDLNDHG